MAQYTKLGNRYKDGGRFVAADSVPESAKSILEEAAEGTVVDELGDVVNPETDIDESEDETAPTADLSDEDLDEDEDEDEEPEAEPQIVQSKPKRKKQEDEDEETGMGFKRAKGKTLSIFSNVPHETVKHIYGLMVPLTHVEHEEKTDAEIIAKLKELGKLA